MIEGDILYRAEAYIDENGQVNITFVEYLIIRQTENGFWIRQKSFHYSPKNKKWIKKNAKRPFARQTKKQALDDLARRKKWHNAFMHEKIHANERILNYINENAVRIINELN